MLFNRPQGLDCTWSRLRSASQVCFENSLALRTLTTSTFKSEEEEEKGSLPACPSWVVSACLATYISHVPCVSVHGIHTTTILSLRVSSIQNLAYRIRKRYVVSCVASTRQICFPTSAGELPANLAQGQQPRGHPGKPRQAPMYLYKYKYVVDRRRRGAFSSPERSPTGRPVA